MFCFLLFSTDIFNISIINRNRMNSYIWNRNLLNIFLLKIKKKDNLIFYYFDRSIFEIRKIKLEIFRPSYRFTKLFQHHFGIIFFFILHKFIWNFLLFLEHVFVLVFIFNYYINVQWNVLNCILSTLRFIVYALTQFSRC